MGELALTKYTNTINKYIFAPVAQLDRVLGYEPRGREFESLRARLRFKSHTFVCITPLTRISYKFN